jgi:uncharacterized protein (TIGR02680 family)
MRGSRFRPVRAGIVNLWDYTDHEFSFHGGRLVLRGANGSGKTKALELLFPFLFDASLSPARLDPFSGTGRTMRDNLLYRPGRDTVTGYAWMEFANDSGACWVIGAGLRAQRARNEVKPWFFVTNRSMGKGWSLSDGERHPLSDRALADELGAANVFQNARDYRERVDRELFGGIGADRYSALIQLVLFLRRPQLAKDLDLRQLSDTLSAGLRPVDEELLSEGAKSFEDLEAVQKELERLEKAAAATDTFLRAYKPYVRVVSRYRADGALHAVRSERDASRAILFTGERVELCAATYSEAQRLFAETEAEKGRLESEREVQLRSEAYKSIGQLEDRRQLVSQARSELETATRALEASRLRLSGDEYKAANATREAGEAAALANRALEVVRVSAVAVVPLRMPEIDALEAADDPVLILNGIVRERRLDGETVLSLLRLADRAVEQAERAEGELAESVAALEQAERSLVEAEGKLNEARSLLVGAIASWSALWDWVGPADEAALIGVTEAELPNLREVALDRASPVRSEIVSKAARLESEAVALTNSIDKLDVELQMVESERDDAPPASTVARRDRNDGRLGANEVVGAPFWRLVDFAPGLSDAEKAGLEAALSGAGILDAWVSPLATTTTEESLDTFLVPISRGQNTELSAQGYGGGTLRSVLQPDLGNEHATDFEPVRAQGISTERIEAILQSIDLGSVGLVDLASGQPNRHANGFRVDLEGRFDLGLLHGRTSQDHAGFIGATARAARRKTRIEELRAQINELAQACQVVRDAQETLAQSLTQVDTSIDALPSVQDLIRGLKSVDGAASETVRRRAEQRRRAEEAQRASTKRSSALETMHNEARLRSVPANHEELRTFSEAVSGLDKAAQEVRVSFEKRRQCASRAEEFAETLRLQSDVVAGDSAAKAQRERDLTNRAAELATLQDTVGVDARDVAETLQMLDGELASVALALKEYQSKERQGSTALAQAEAARDSAQSEHQRSVERVHAAMARLTVLRRPELRAVLEIDDATDLASFLPILSAACQGVVATDEQRQARKTGVRNAFQVMESQLGSRYVASLDDADDIDLVVVADEEGRSSIANFAGRIAQRRDEQRTLLSAQEREVLENTLIDTLCRQLHTRLRDGEDQVKRMNATLAGRRTTSGKGVQLSWTANDAISDDQKEIVKLLDRSPEFLGADDRSKLRQALAHEIKAARANDLRSGYLEVLGKVLDYRSWRAFGIRLKEADGSERPLTKKLFNTHSGGEKATVLHLPLFAAAAAHFDAASPHAPRLVALDEAFAGIDGATTRELLGLTVQFDLDVFLTGHDFWGAVPEVPQLSIVSLSHHRDSHTVASLNSRWDGHMLTYEGDR